MSAMASEGKAWTLEDLIDFESEIAAGVRVPEGMRDEVVAASAGLEGAAARRAGLRVWLEGVRGNGAGRRFSAALGICGWVLGLVMFVAGVSGVFAMVDAAKYGIHIGLFLAVMIGGQWVLLVAAGLAWLLRRRAAEGFSMFQGLLAGWARRMAGGREAAWWSRLMTEAGPGRLALLWRVSRLVQGGGIFFNLGILAGLAGLMLVRELDFYWESTTETTMLHLLERVTGVLSAPWGWWRDAVPDRALLETSRWRPGEPLESTGMRWWLFCMMSTLVWGMLPRVLWWLLSWKSGCKALAALDFQSREHRILWRELTATSRSETDEQAPDGVLVLDVGGSGMEAAALRPFMLRRLRVHPTAWLSVAVLDPGAEEDAGRALAAAPSGVVLLAEGWALAPAAMTALHAKVRASAGPEAPVKFLIANPGSGNQPLPPTDAEIHEWERFVDSLRDPRSEVFFFQPDASE